MIIPNLGWFTSLRVVRAEKDRLQIDYKCARFSEGDWDSQRPELPEQTWSADGSVRGEDVPPTLRIAKRPSFNPLYRQWIVGGLQQPSPMDLQSEIITLHRFQVRFEHDAREKLHFRSSQYGAVSYVEKIRHTFYVYTETEAICKEQTDLGNFATRFFEMLHNLVFRPCTEHDDCKEHPELGQACQLSKDLQRLRA